MEASLAFCFVLEEGLKRFGCLLNVLIDQLLMAELTNAGSYGQPVLGDTLHPKAYTFNYTSTLISLDVLMFLYFELVFS